MLQVSTGKRRMNGRKFAMRMIPILLILVVLAGYLELRAQLAPVDQDRAEQQVTLEVPRNATTAQIAGLLEQEGLVRSAMVFRLYARYRGVDGQFKPGTYVLNPAMSPDAITAELVRGPDEIIRITIPEGYTVAQIAGLLDEKGIAEQEEFLGLTDGEWDYPYLKEIPADHNRLEGYLFPDTYHLGPESGPDKLIRMMLDRFNSVIEENNYVERAAERGLTLHEAVTFASMVEREARVAGERALIAGVIYNRLEMGMPLQIDATIQYVLDQPREVLLYKDLEVDSPYNTYKHTGLPPGPIACPGWPSLQAVIEPEDTDYLYYVAKPDGSHAFARTLDEHNRNIRQYQ